MHTTSSRVKGDACPQHPPAGQTIAASMGKPMQSACMHWATCIMLLSLLCLAPGASAQSPSPSPSISPSPPDSPSPLPFATAPQTSPPQLVSTLVGVSVTGPLQWAEFTIATRERSFTLPDCYLLWSTVVAMRTRPEYLNYTCEVDSKIDTVMTSFIRLTAFYDSSNGDTPLALDGQLFLNASTYSDAMGALQTGCQAEASYNDSMTVPSVSRPWFACPTGKTTTSVIENGRTCTVFVVAPQCTGLLPPVPSPVTPSPVPTACTATFVASKGGAAFPISVWNGTNTQLQDYCGSFSALAKGYFDVVGITASPVCKDQGWTSGMAIFSTSVPTLSQYNSIVAAFSNAPDMASIISQGLHLGCTGSITVFSSDCSPTPVTRDYLYWPLSFQCMTPSPSPSPINPVLPGVSQAPWWWSPTPTVTTISFGLALGFKTAWDSYKFIQAVPCSTLLYISRQAMKLNSFFMGTPDCTLNKKAARITMTFQVTNSSQIDGAAAAMLGDGLSAFVWKARLPCETNVYLYSEVTGQDMTFSCIDGYGALCCPEPWRRTKACNKKCDPYNATCVPCKSPGLQPYYPGYEVSPDVNLNSAGSPDQYPYNSPTSLGYNTNPLPSSSPTPSPLPNPFWMSPNTPTPSPSSNSFFDSSLTSSPSPSPPLSNDVVPGN